MNRVGSERVLLHVELSALVTGLWHEIDHGDGSTVSDFFTPGAELTFFDRTLRGRTEITEVYRARTARGPRVSRHLMSNLHVLGHDDTTAYARSVLVLHAEDGQPPVPATAPLLVADVHDHFVRAVTGDGEQDGWLIAARRLEHCFLAPGAVLAVPTETEDDHP